MAQANLIQTSVGGRTLNALAQHVPAGGVFWVSGSYLTT